MVLIARAAESGLSEVTLLASDSWRSTDGLLRASVDTVPRDALVCVSLALMMDKAPI
jgi:hypothetical protein